MNQLLKRESGMEFVDLAPRTRELTLADLLMVLRRRRKLIALTTTICLLLGLAVCVFSRPQYEATGVLEIPKISADMLNVQNMMTDASSLTGGDALNASLDLQTEAEILQSEALALKVIEQLNLDKTWDFQPRRSPIGVLMGLFSSPTQPDPAGAGLEDSPQRRTSATKIFAAHLKVDPVPGTRLIHISYFHSDRRVAPAVVNELVRAAQDYGFQTRYAATTESSVWLNRQLGELKKQTQVLQAKVVTLQKDSGVYSLGNRDAQGREEVYSETLDRLQQATAALTSATSNRILKGAVYETARNRDPELISGLAGSSLMGASEGVQSSFTLLQTLRQQQSLVQAQLAQDSSKFGSAYAPLADERSSLESVTQAISSEVNRIGERAANDFRASEGAEQNLKEVYDQRKVEAEKLNDKATEYGIAKQEADDSRELYEDLFKRLKEAGVIDGLRSSNISIVEPGRVPAKAAKPNIPVYLGAFLFSGLFLGVCGAVLLDSVDSKIQSFDRVEQLLGVPLLCVLPKLEKPARKVLPGTVDLSDVEALNIADQRTTAFAESLRGLKTKLLSSRATSGPEVILVTSSVPAEGKTTVSVNLASLLARSGKRVLLVEADMRNPSLGKRSSPSTDSSSELSVLLRDTEKLLKSVPTMNECGMEVLSAGPLPLLPAELLGSDRMRELLEQWKLQYDYVVLDSPPVMAVTDASVLAQMADVTLLIARPGLTSSKALQRAYASLISNRTTKVGVVLNAVDRESTNYTEYYGYSGSTYYVKPKEHYHA